MRTFRGTYTRPTRAALKGTLGDAPVRLQVSRELRRTLMARLAKTPSPAEAAVRRWYGEHLEPVLRFLPDRTMRGVWAVQRVCQPVLTPLRRPRDRRPRVTLKMRVPYLAPDQRGYVGAVIRAKVPAIPAGDEVEVWDQIGRRVSVTWTLRRRPPARVGYGDLAARIGGLAEWEFFLGMGAAEKPKVISLREDSPHLALSAGSGAGKSVLAMLVAVQVLCRGGLVVILDRKGSHRWALGLPGVVYCTNAAQMHAELLRLDALADERNTLAFLSGDEDFDPGPRVLVLAEELNATFTQLRDHWEQVRAKGDPKVSPAVKAFRNLLFMGRSAKVNVLAVAQMLSANTTGGPESRENFGIRCLARYTVNNWKMLVPEAAMPRSSRTLGRWQIVVAGVATETQVCFLTAAEARLMVHKHRGYVPVPGEDSWSEPIKGERAHVGDAGTAETVSPLAERVTIRDASERGLLPWNYETARKRLRRGRERDDILAPSPVGTVRNADLYLVGDLLAWIESELVG